MGLRVDPRERRAREQAYARPTIETATRQAELSRRAAMIAEQSGDHESAALHHRAAAAHAHTGASAAERVGLTAEAATLRQHATSSEARAASPQRVAAPAPQGGHVFGAPGTPAAAEQDWRLRAATANRASADAARSRAGSDAYEAHETAGGHHRAAAEAARAAGHHREAAAHEASARQHFATAEQHLTPDPEVQERPMTSRQSAAQAAAQIASAEADGSGSAEAHRAAAEAHRRAARSGGTPQQVAHHEAEYDRHRAAYTRSPVAAAERGRAKGYVQQPAAPSSVAEQHEALAARHEAQGSHALASSHYAAADAAHSRAGNHEAAQRAERNAIRLENMPGVAAQVPRDALVRAERERAAAYPAAGAAGRPKAIAQTQHGTATTHTPHDQAMSRAAAPAHSREQHAAAAQTHMLAADEARRAGDAARAREHSIQQGQHLTAMREIDRAAGARTPQRVPAHLASPEAYDRETARSAQITAETASRAAYAHPFSDAAGARQRHLVAAQLHRAAGNEVQARSHETAASAFGPGRETPGGYRLHSDPADVRGEAAIRRAERGTGGATAARTPLQRQQGKKGGTFVISKSGKKRYVKKA